jgi:hypothetical protein
VQRRRHTVVRDDSIVASYSHQRPLVLVLRRSRTGGCESRWRYARRIHFQTNIDSQMPLKNLYPIEDDECLYCPDLPVAMILRREWIRDDNTYASFVACPADQYYPKIPNLIWQSLKQLHPNALSTELQALTAPTLDRCHLFM